MNPFLYGNKDELSQFRQQTPLIAQPTEANSDLRESVDGVNPVPESLLDLFTNNPDVKDGGAGKAFTGDVGPLPSELEISTRRNESQYQKTTGLVASTSVGKKQVKKVWAKKKFADSKFEKGRKRS